MMDRGFNRIRLGIVAGIMSATMFVACKPSTPGDVLSSGKMEDILYDYHLAIAMADNDEENRGVNSILYKEAVFRKYDITEAEFDSSMVYYMRHTEQLHKIYNNLTERFNAEAVRLGANVSDMNRFGELSSKGDTMNIWNGARSLVFFTSKPLNCYNFEIKADSSYHKGDCIMLDFDSQFIYQDGMRDALAVLAIQFSNDSVGAQLVHVQNSQHYSLQVQDNDTLGIKAVKGYFLLNRGDFSSEESSSLTTLKLMFLENIRMIRMHQKPVASPDPLSKPNSTTSDSLHKNRKADSTVAVEPIDAKPLNPQPIPQAGKPLRPIAVDEKMKVMPPPNKLKIRKTEK